MLILVPCKKKLKLNLLLKLILVCLFSKSKNISTLVRRRALYNICNSLCHCVKTNIDLFIILFLHFYVTVLLLHFTMNSLNGDTSK